MLFFIFFGFNVLQVHPNNKAKPNKNGPDSYRFKQ